MSNRSTGCTSNNANFMDTMGESMFYGIKYISCPSVFTALVMWRLRTTSKDFKTFQGLWIDTKHNGQRVNGLRSSSHRNGGYLHWLSSWISAQNHTPVYILYKRIKMKNFPRKYRTVFLIKAHFRSGCIISIQIP